MKRRNLRPSGVLLHAKVTDSLGSRFYDFLDFLNVVSVVHLAVNQYCGVGTLKEPETRQIPPNGTDYTSPATDRLITNSNFTEFYNFGVLICIHLGFFGF